MLKIEVVLFSNLIDSYLTSSFEKQKLRLKKKILFNKKVMQ